MERDEDFVYKQGGGALAVAVVLVGGFIFYGGVALAILL